MGAANASSNPLAPPLPAKLAPQQLAKLDPVDVVSPNLSCYFPHTLAMTLKKLILGRVVYLHCTCMIKLSSLHTSQHSCIL